MKLRQMVIAAVAAGTVAASGIALAQPMGEWHHGGGEGMGLLHGITLTDAQKAQIKTIHQSTWAQMKPIMTQMRALHEQMATQLLTAGTVTAEQLTPLAQQEEALRNQMDSARLSEMLQIRSLLTAEQLAQAATTHAKLEALHEQEHAVMTGAEEGPEGPQ